MIPGRSALTEQCRAMLNFIDARGVTSRPEILATGITSETTYIKHIRLLEQRGFIARDETEVRSLSTSAPNTHDQARIFIGNVVPIASRTPTRAVNGCPLSQGGQHGPA